MHEMIVARRVLAKRLCKTPKKKIFLSSRCRFNCTMKHEAVEKKKSEMKTKNNDLVWTEVNMCYSVIASKSALHFYKKSKKFKI